MGGGEFVFIDWIDKNIEKGKSILELGSGHVSTKQLSDMGYKMNSIEHDGKYVGLYNSNYIYAPLKNSWYDVDVLKQHLPELKYDVLLIDGPVGVGNNSRTIFLKYMNLFNTNVPIIIHDVERNAEQHLKEELSRILNRSWKILDENIKPGMTAII